MPGPGSVDAQRRNAKSTKEWAKKQARPKKRQAAAPAPSRDLHTLGEQSDTRHQKAEVKKHAAVQRYRKEAPRKEFKATVKRYLASPQGRSDVATLRADRETRRLAADFRRQTGLTNLSTEPYKVRQQAAAQLKFIARDDPLQPDRLANQIKMSTPDRTPAALKKTAAELKAAGVPDAAVAKALNALKKKPESFALRALSQLTRPVSGVAGATRATYKGKNPATAFVDGVVDNDQSFSAVLKDVGAPKWVQTVGGLALDVALDPTTYVTLGASVPAQVAAKGALKSAQRAGANADEALAIARKVYDQHPQKARGLQVGARGLPVRAMTGGKKRQIATSGTTTSKLVGAPAKKALSGTAKLPGLGKLAAQGDKAGVQFVNAYRPRGLHPVDHAHARAAARKYRAARGSGERLAAARVKAYQAIVKKQNIGPGGLDRIAVALDAGKLGSLAGAERELADILKRDLAGIAAREVKAGVRSADAVLDGYWPRVLRAIAGADAAGGMGSAGQRVTGSSFQARKDRRAIEDMAPEEAARYLTDDLEPIAKRLGDHGRALSLATLHTEVAALGPAVKSLDEIENVGGTLATTYVRDGKGFRRLWKDGEGYDATLGKIEAAIKAGHEVRAIPHEAHEYVFATAQRGKSGGGTGDGMLGRGFDITQGRLKTLQTVVNPGYHVTNLIGDLFNAKVGGASFGEIKGAVRQVRQERKLDAFNGDVLKGIEDLSEAKLARGGKTEVYGDNGPIPDAVIVDMAREHGAIQTGFAGSELHALQQTKTTKGYRLDQRFLEGARHANELREDVVRLVSFRSALKRGDSPAEAAAHVARTHIDYADLTEAERRFARRVVPFYTFARHNIPIQARGLAGSPGRYATVEKTRDASAESSGLDENFAYGLPSYVQRQVPFAIPGGASAAGLPLAANLKLPLNDLNALDIRTWPDEVAQRMSVLVKMPAEQWMKYDAFFKDEIRKDFVPAPSWVMNPAVKKGIEESTGSKIKMIYDRKSGDMVPGWSWRVDKAFRLLPITGAISNVTTPGKTRHAKGALAAAGYLAGPRPFTLDPGEAKTQLLFDELDNLTSEQTALKQTVKHRSGDKWGGKIKELGERMSEIQAEIAKLDASAGYDSARFSKPKPKSNGKTYRFGSGAGSSSGSRFGGSDSFGSSGSGSRFGP